MSHYGEDGIFGIVTLGNINIDVLKKVEFYLINATQQSKVESVQKPLDLKQRYNQLLDEIASKETPLDLKYKQILEEIKSEKSSPPSSLQTTVVNLKGKEIKYDDKEAKILINDTVCQLPPYKNEHYLCGVMFKKKINQPIDWSVVYEKMSGDYETHYGKPPKTREHWRSVYDTMIRINSRIKKDLHTTDDLFSWQELTIKRNF